MVFHLLAGWRCRPAPTEWPAFAGGLGWPLAALHLVTFGVLGMTALGAGAQLLPVATRQPAPGHSLLAAIWWLYTPGVAACWRSAWVAAMPAVLAVGAVTVTLALRRRGAC